MRIKSIRLVAKQSLESKIRTKHWLLKSKPLNHSKYLQAEPDVTQNLLEGILSARKRRRDIPQKLIDLNILCANLLSNGRYTPTAISLNRNSYTPSRYIQASYFIIDAVNYLVNAGYIEISKGIHTKKESRNTRIWPTNKLIKLFKDDSKTEIIPIELVELRDIKGNCIDYKDTEQTINTRSILRKANISNRMHVVTFDRYKLDTDLHAIYNLNLYSGGRLYVCASNKRKNYQQLSKKDRQEILIDGMKTIELDFTATQPSLLYAQEGIQLTFDPYQHVLDVPRAS